MNKFSYEAKLEILNAMSAKIAALRTDVGRLSELEELATDPNFSEFYVMGTALDELAAEVVDLLEAVEPMAFFEKKSA